MAVACLCRLTMDQTRAVVLMLARCLGRCELAKEPLLATDTDTADCLRRAEESRRGDGGVKEGVLRQTRTSSRLYFGKEEEGFAFERAVVA